jgi:hypothetical protein
MLWRGCATFISARVLLPLTSFLVHQHSVHLVPKLTATMHQTYSQVSQYGARRQTCTPSHPSALVFAHGAIARPCEHRCTPVLSHAPSPCQQTGTQHPFRIFRPHKIRTTDAQSPCFPFNALIEATFDCDGCACNLLAVLSASEYRLLSH